ncbi:MAG: DedA family protein [candidate division SR1 bacterium]|nr:DedA family protein [candidate division SR1 bacterium]
MGITEFLATYITAFIHQTGYITVFLGMMMESMIFPVPSEAIMPFAGFLIAMKQFSLRGVILISTAGSIVGSLISYAIGYYGGKPFIRKFGKYFLLDQEELEGTEHFFKKRGSITILISRFIPVVRHLISLPAGMGKMNLTKFIVYTLVGAGLRNTFLALVGKYLKENRELVMKYSKIVDVVVLVILVGIVARFVYRQVSKRMKRKNLKI